MILNSGVFEWYSARLYLPPFDEPVFMYIPALKETLIGCACETSDGAWSWINLCENIRYKEDKNWAASAPWHEGPYSPSFWAFLPPPPHMYPSVSAEEFKTTINGVVYNFCRLRMTYLHNMVFGRMPADIDF